ncbi:hypothetical protein BH20ACI4_BH20ACI4_22910 [soil metagenome]
MKNCPGCQNQYSDEYDFCLKDGTRLVSNIAQVMPLGAVTQSLNFCGKCAAPMTAEFAFCKKCGTPRSNFQGQTVVVPTVQTSPVNVGDSFESPNRWEWFENNKPLVIVGAVLVILPLLIGVFVYSTSSNNNAQMMSNTNLSRSNTVVTALKNTDSGYRTNSNYTTSNQTYSNSGSGINGETGRLTTDLNLRDEPNKYAYSVGIHFKDARVIVLETASYELEGAVATWYRIRVTEFGCSVDANLGCGKNSPNDADEGWVNSKYILLD